MIKVAIGLFVLGLSFGSGPCLASCGPLLLSFIGGTRKNIFKSLLTYTLFSVSRIAVYVLLSLLIYFLGRFVFTKVWVGFLRYLVMLGGIFIIILGLIIALGKSYKFKWCGSKKSVLIMGSLVGLLPCAPLLVIFTYIGLMAKSWVSAFLYGTSFGLGTFISPLILLVIFAGFMPKFLSGKKEIYTRIFNLICGLIIVILGMQLIRRVF